MDGWGSKKKKKETVWTQTLREVKVGGWVKKTSDTNIGDNISHYLNLN